MPVLSSAVSALSHLLPGQPRPVRRRAGRDLDRPAAGQAADDRGVRLQEERRPAVPLPRQLARAGRELPADDVRLPGRALRGRPDHGQGAGPAAHPARRPRAELLHLDRAPRRLRPGQPVRLGLRRHQRAVRPAARRRQPGRAGDAAADQGQRRRRRRVRRARSRTRRTVSSSWASGTASTRTTTRAPRSSRRPPTSCSSKLGVQDPLLDIALQLEQVALVRRLLRRAQALPERRLLHRPDLQGDGLPDQDVHRAVRPRPAARLDRPVARDDRGPGDQDRPPAPGLHRCRPSASTSASTPAERGARTRTARERPTPTGVGRSRAAPAGRRRSRSA